MMIDILIIYIMVIQIVKVFKARISPQGSGQPMTGHDIMNVNVNWKFFQYSVSFEALPKPLKGEASSKLIGSDAGAL